jgi:hypothetical protein
MHRFDLVEWINDLARYGTYALLAAFGGAVGITNQAISQNKIPTLSRVFIAAFTSAFTGVLVVMICDALQLEEIYKAPVIAFCGWYGSDQTLKLIQKTLLKRYGIDRREHK